MKKFFVAAQSFEGLAHIPDNPARHSGRFSILLVTLWAAHRFGFTPHQENAGQGFFEFLAADWFGDISIHPRFDTTLAIPLHGVSRHGDNWQVHSSFSLTLPDFHGGR